MKKTDMDTGAKMKAARLSKSWTLDDAAERIGIARSSLSDWERGKSAPNARHHARIAMVLGVALANGPTPHINDAEADHDLSSPPLPVPKGPACALNPKEDRIALSTDLLREMDAWRAGQPVPPTRSQLIECAITQFLRDHPLSTGRKG